MKAMKATVSITMMAWARRLRMKTSMYGKDAGGRLMSDARQ
jgi:hypothetical protein